MEYEQWREKWLVKSIHYLKMIREDFEKGTGRKVEECRVELIDGEIRFFWNDSPKPWQTARVGEIDPKDVFITLYRLFQSTKLFPPLPWGSMQGVRPAKLLQSYVEQGDSLAKGVERIAVRYDVEPERAELLGKVVSAQARVLQDTEGTMGLYLGIPFCPSRCFYCSFSGEVVPKNKSEMIDFWQFFKQDLLGAIEWINQSSEKLSTIYIGGGTPTTLPISIFSELCEILSTQLDLSRVVDFTLEAGRPETITLEKLVIAKNAGVNRVSVNPQSMHQQTLDQVGRTHRVDEIYQAVELVRKVQFQSLNMDLIAGLPGESVEDFVDSLEKILLLNPENITIHSLALKKGSTWLENQKNLPIPQVVRQMVEIGRRVLLEKEYLPYYLYRQKNSPGHLENIGYSKVGHESLYNIQIMDETHSVIGIGPGAATKKREKRGKIYNYHFPKDRRSYERDLNKYLGERQEILNQADRGIYYGIFDSISNRNT